MDQRIRILMMLHKAYIREMTETDICQEKKEECDSPALKILNNKGTEIGKNNFIDISSDKQTKSQLRRPRYGHKRKISREKINQWHKEQLY